MVLLCCCLVFSVFVCWVKLLDVLLVFLINVCCFWVLVGFFISCWCLNWWKLMFICVIVCWGVGKIYLLVSVNCVSNGWLVLLRSLLRIRECCICLIWFGIISLWFCWSRDVYRNWMLLVMKSFLLLLESWYMKLKSGLLFLLLFLCLVIGVVKGVIIV